MGNTMTDSYLSPTTLRSTTHVADDGYEYLVVTVGAGAGRSAKRRAAAAKEALVERSDKGRWELLRTVLYQGGVSRHWMRRRITKVLPTL
jgi:hypothetical protein